MASKNQKGNNNTKANKPADNKQKGPSKQEKEDLKKRKIDLYRFNA